MKKTNEENIEILNRLIEINNCRIEIYEQAEQEAEGPTMRYLFSRLAENSRQCRKELSYEVRKLGGVPKQGISASGKIYSAWIRVKIALSNKNKNMILNSCANGEDVNIKAYQDMLSITEEALENYAELIEKQCSLLKADHDRIKNLSRALLKS